MNVPSNKNTWSIKYVHIQIILIKEYSVLSVHCISVSSSSFLWQKFLKRNYTTPNFSIGFLLSLDFYLLLMDFYCYCGGSGSGGIGGSPGGEQTPWHFLIQIKPKPFTQIKLPHFNCLCICNHLAKCLQFLPTPICWMNPES